MFFSPPFQSEHDKLKKKKRGTIPPHYEENKIKNAINLVLKKLFMNSDVYF